MGSNYLNLGEPSHGSQVQDHGLAESIQRSVSYGEIVALEESFEEQIKYKGIEFSDDEEKDEARFDFIQQYIDGDDNPQIKN